jgi:asparagine synthase (glutamine-hydrolysing)
VSTIGGVFYFDSRPVPPDDSARLHPPDGSPWRNLVLHRAPGLLLGRASSRLEARDPGSLAVAESGSVCAWDGRLDNAASLRAPFARRLPHTAGASVLALAVYESGGPAGLRSLIGDWSSAIWDARSRTVVLASDFAGVRPLYYHCNSQALHWSSSLSSLVEWIGANELDDGYISRFLAGGSAPADLTPYHGVYPVPPGHAVCVSAEGTSIVRFWELPVEQELRLQDERDYEDGLRNLFREGVEARVQGIAPVCAELSGGLDSSCVVAMAHHVLPAGSGQESKLVTFSYTHEGCRDEPYFKAMERACGTKGVHLDLNQYLLVTADHTGGAFPNLWGSRFAELARQVDHLGAGVLLTGQFGDFIMGNLVDDSDQVVDYLERRQFVRAAREAFAWSRSLQVPVYSILARALRTRYGSWAAPLDSGVWSGPRTALTEADSLTPKIRGKIREQLQAARKDDRDEPSRRLEPRPGARRRFRTLSSILNGRTLQAPEALQHIDYTHPYAHRPLVEFMMTIPPSQVCRPGETRRLMRRAFAGLTPPAILNRKSKATYGDIFREALLRLAREMRTDAARNRVVEAGYVERDNLAQRLTCFTQGLECNEMQLRQIILLEFWLRQREPCGSAASELVASAK